MAKNYTVLYGRNSVIERLKAAPSTVRKVFLQDTVSDSRIVGLTGRHKVALERLTAERIVQMRPAKDSQGVIARVNPYRYTPFDELMAQAEKKKTSFVFLDRVTDPQNLGVLMRILACFGGFALVIPQYKACEVNETVLHVASGSENYLPIARVANLTNAILALKKKGYWIMGAVVDDTAQDLRSISLPFPLGLVLGSEGEGIRYGVDKHLDIKAKIPMEGAELSFNVAMACAIFGYEISRQRGAA